MTAPIRAVPWLIAVIGRAVPLVGGGGAGWMYVVGWLVVLASVRLLRPLGQADRRERIVVAAVVAVALVAPWARRRGLASLAGRRDRAHGLLSVLATGPAIGRDQTEAHALGR